jgi:hypothetical protein
MRPAFRRGWEGEGKPKSMPWRGPASAQLPPHGGVYSGFGNERAKLLAFPLKQRNSAGQALTETRSGSQGTVPSHGATQTGDVPAQAEGATRLLSEAQRRRRSERASGAHPTRREARAPAGQRKDAAPTGARSAGQSASLSLPVRPPRSRSSPEWAGTTGPVRTRG